MSYKHQKEKEMNIQADSMNALAWKLYESSLQEINENTIFYIWDFSSDTFQSNSIFQKLFGISPKNSAEFKNLILEDDCKKLECIIKENKNLSNAMMPLRMKTKDQIYTAFIIRFGQISKNTISGTLYPMHSNSPQSENDNHMYGDSTPSTIEYERKSFAIEAAKAGLWDWNPTTDEVYYDDRYISMLGYGPDEFKQVMSSWANCVHPDDYDETVKKQLETIESPKHGDSFTCTYRFLAANGDYLWILGQGKVITRDSKGRALRLVGLHTDITEEENAKQQIDFMLKHDILTGLYNRHYFETHFTSTSIEALPAAFILADADGLKMINDCINHASGDRILQQIAHILRMSVRSSDLLARIGGDEFAIFLPNTKEQDAKKIVQKINNTIKNTNGLNTGIVVCASLGLACATTLEELSSLTIRADAAMVEQKQKQKQASLKEIVNFLGSARYANYKDERIKK